MPVEPPTTPTPPSSSSNAARSPQSSRAGGFRRFQIGTNVVIQLALVIVIIAMANGYAFKHFKRFDFSRDRKYALSPRTKQLLASLNKPVKLIVFMAQGSPLQNDVANLAEEYRVAQPKFIQLEQINPFRDVGRAGEIQAKYKLAQQENVVILDSEIAPRS